MSHPNQVTHLQNLIVGHNKWKSSIDTFLFGCQVNNLTPNTISNYAERLRYVVGHFISKGIEFDQINRVHIQEYIHKMLAEKKLSDATINGRIQTMQRFWSYLIEEGIWTTSSPTYKIKKIRTSRIIRDVVGPEDIQKIITLTNKNSFVGYRNTTMLLLFWDCMLRRNELLTLTIDRVDLRLGIIKVIGKGRKERELAIGLKMLKTLHNYLTKWRQNVPGNLVFVTEEGNALDKDNVRQIIIRMGKKANVHLHPHLIRHSACTWFLRNGGSPVIAQRILGHTTQSMTSIYTHLNCGDIVTAYQKLSPSNSITI